MVRAVYEVTLIGEAQERKARGEILDGGRPIATSAWRLVPPGGRVPVQIQLDASPGVYRVRQVTNVGSNIHEDLVTQDRGVIQHG